jgi:UDP-N-acetylglucosamine--N-acetylmuramyl-(pentapeptide) pyrophosphoryl-undecaprenol N-acetylglucosamine transferase
MDSIEEAYSASDLVITRSGSSAIFEIALFGKPMILIPYPFAMSHQAENARVFSAKGAAIEIRERDLSPETFRKEIIALLDDRKRREEMARAAAALSVPRSSDNLADEVFAFAEKGCHVSG